MTASHERSGTTEGMRVEDAISGREGLRGVQWLLLDGQSLDLIRRVLSGMLLAPQSLGGCRLTRAKFKSGHKLTAYFDVSLRPSGTATACTRPVVVTWSKEKRNGQGEDAEDLQAEAKRRDVSAPFRELSAEAPGWNLRVKVAPFDTSFPQLVRLSDPAYAGEVLETHGRLPEVCWLRYRPGHRHVLRYHVPSPSGCRAVFLKLYSAGQVHRAYEDSVQMSDWLAARGSGMACLRPVSFLEADSAVLFPEARGTPLSAFFEGPNPSLSSLLEHTGAALRLLQTAPATLTRGQRREFAGHAEMLTSTIAHRAALLPRAADELTGFLERVHRAHERIGCEPEVFAHGDMKAEHVYVADRELTFIDFDCRCLADPAYDAGKFMADLELRLSPCGPAAVEEAQAHFLAGYAPQAERLARIRLWQAMMMVYLGWRRLQWFQPDPAAALEDILRRADRVLRSVESAYSARTPSRTRSH